jgi:hypothetical protein
MNNNHVNHNLRLHSARFMISCRGQGGLTIERLIHERSDLFCFLHTSSKIIYLQIGGNDLSSTSTDIVANEVYSLWHKNSNRCYWSTIVNQPEL